MARGRSRRGGEYGEFWPAYVDVLSTLLLVVTLLMSIFMIAQYFSAEEVSGKDSALKRLTRQITELTSMLSLEKGKSQSSQDELAALQATLGSLKAENEKLTGAGLGADERAKAAEGKISGLSAELQSQKNISDEALSKVDLLNQQLIALRRQIAGLSDALDAAEKKGADSDKTIKDLGARLNAALAMQVQELKRYRSDFFGRLRELLKDRKDIRVVGDRFVFESEVLFPSGSATLTPEACRPWIRSQRRSLSCGRKFRRTSTGHCRSTGTPMHGRFPIRSIHRTGSCRRPALRRSSNIWYHGECRPIALSRPATANSSRSIPAIRKRPISGTAASS